MSAPRPFYDVGPGRTICRDGVALFALVDEPRNPANPGSFPVLSAQDGDDMAHRIAVALNAWPAGEGPGLPFDGFDFSAIVYGAESYLEDLESGVADHTYDDDEDNRDRIERIGAALKAVKARGMPPAFVLDTREHAMCAALFSAMCTEPRDFDNVADFAGCSPAEVEVFASRINPPDTTSGGGEPYTPAANVRAALAHLRAARDLLKSAGASKAADKVRAAITSADGARRHAEGVASRPARP